MQVPRSKGAVSGVLLVLLGLWAALIPFVGPYFDYGFGQDTTWVWHLSRLWLNVLPGAAVVLGGLVLLGLAERISLAAAAWLTVVAGAWLVLGPNLSVLWHHNTSATGLPLGGAHRQVYEYLGFHYAVGALIIFFGAMALGRLTVTSVRDVDVAGVTPNGHGHRWWPHRPVAPAAPAPVTPAEPTAEPTATEPTATEPTAQPTATEPSVAQPGPPPPPPQQRPVAESQQPIHRR